jgi:hypothetical protein
MDPIIIQVVPDFLETPGLHEALPGKRVVYH